MGDQIDELYYTCIDKIDENNIEIAEEYLIGCVTFLHRQTHGRADRDRVTEDFSISRGMEKYIDELTIISRMKESTLATLIASSLDLSKEIERLVEVHSKIEDAVYDEVQAYNQTSKIRKGIEILTAMEKLVNDKGGRIQPSLFEGEDG